MEERGSGAALARRGRPGRYCSTRLGSGQALALARPAPAGASLCRGLLGLAGMFPIWVVDQSVLVLALVLGRALGVCGLHHTLKNCSTCRLEDGNPGPGRCGHGHGHRGHRPARP